MANDRLRIAVEADSVSALGLAMYCFAILEWNVVWSCERLMPGSIDSLPDRTAGAIAKKFAQLVSDLTSSPVKDQLTPLGSRFAGLVAVRNAIAHGKPGTDTDGGQRLFRDGVPWTVATLNSAADDFTSCGAEFNAFMYSHRS